MCVLALLFHWLSPPQSTDQYDLNSFDLHYYHDASISFSERSFYNDDGSTNNAFEKGMYESIGVSFDHHKKISKIKFEAEIGSHYDAVLKTINLVIHNWDDQPKRISINGKKIKNASFNDNMHVLTIPVQWNTLKDLTLKIKH